MMCKCRQEIQAKIREKLYPNAEYISVMSMELFSNKTFSMFEVTVPGKKKKEKVHILHSYCPHCGCKYDEPMQEPPQGVQDL